MTVFTPHQDAALSAVGDWLKAKPGRKGTPQVFRLFGYAGTGKTTLARHVADAIDGTAMFAAFTGKAASVMRSKGCYKASTIHSLIYRTRESGEEVPSFDLWDEAPASKADLLIIDECSMVDQELGRDLMSFGVPILVLGDPAQLPPIQTGNSSGAGFFTEQDPDAMLTEVHRQARDNPIVRLSMDIREGRSLEPGEYGDTQVVEKGRLDPARVLKADQVLVGRNATRRAYNQRMRERRGFEGTLPSAGDKLVFYDFSWQPNTVDNSWLLLICYTILNVQAMSTDQAVLQKYLTTRSAKETTKSLLLYGISTIPLFAHRLHCICWVSSCGTALVEMSTVRANFLEDDRRMTGDDSRDDRRVSPGQRAVDPRR